MEESKQRPSFSEFINKAHQTYKENIVLYLKEIAKKIKHFDVSLVALPQFTLTGKADGVTVSLSGYANKDYLFISLEDSTVTLELIFVPYDPYAVSNIVENCEKDKKSGDYMRNVTDAVIFCLTSPHDVSTLIASWKNPWGPADGKKVLLGDTKVSGKALSDSLIHTLKLFNILGGSPP
jgi:hypothetical protein